MKKLFIAAIILFVSCSSYESYVLYDLPLDGKEIKVTIECIHMNHFNKPLGKFRPVVFQSSDSTFILLNNGVTYDMKYYKMVDGSYNIEGEVLD